MTFWKKMSEIWERKEQNQKYEIMVRDKFRSKLWELIRQLSTLKWHENEQKSMQICMSYFN